MNEIFLQLLSVAYAATGIINFVAYYPTVKDLYVHKKPSANITSYIVWTVTTGTGFVYGLLVLNDLLFRLVSGASFLACATVLFLSIRLKSGR